jgi:aspartyl-tRNA(Asn)/glutamyl-tRNA(Gln) amidotransferase subunit A
LSRSAFRDGRRDGLVLSEAEGAAALAAELAADAAMGGGGFSDDFRALLTYGRTATRERIAEARQRIAAVEVAAVIDLQGIAALVLPTAPQRPFVHGAPVPANQADFTALTSCARLPALPFPIPVPDGGFPASAQFVGPPRSEKHIVAIAEAFVAR